jgi:hypothetical protein
MRHFHPLPKLRLAALAFALVALTAGSRLPAAPKKPEVKTVRVGPNVSVEFEGENRRVVVKAVVCLREGALEGLLTRAKAKEHEYILAAECDARHIHTALETAGAKAGSPVVFHPKYKPARGTTIKVTLRYKNKAGKIVTVPGVSWVREFKNKKPLDKQWVFAGSKFLPNPEKGKPPVYIANHGDVICLVNMESALLDLPVVSPKTLDARIYEAFTERIPDKDTAVEVILEPVLDKKGKGKK